MRSALDLQHTLALSGLDRSAVAPGDDLQHLLPGCRAAVVYGSGRRLWETFLDDLRAHPAHLMAEAHPLDAFVRRLVHAADPSPPPSRRWIFCGAAGDPHEQTLIDFRMLAHAAGLGWKSRIGLLLHPEAGPWLGLRAACLTTDALETLPVTGSLAGEGPCGGCPAPCVTACPAAAIHPAEGWQVGPCARHQGQSSSCEAGCLSRSACPVGAAHRYDSLQLHYHSHRPTGRAALAAHLGIADGREGIGPRWEVWA